jgi:hypothetical protein
LASGLIGVVYSRVEESDEWGDQVRVEGGDAQMSLFSYTLLAMQCSLDRDVKDL